jgi:hypothetical protein
LVTSINLPQTRINPCQLQQDASLEVFGAKTILPPML